MPYTALPDMRMPYDIDGTVIYNREASGNINFDLGPNTAPTGAQIIEINDEDTVSSGNADWHSDGGAGVTRQILTWFFFPEIREVTAYVAGWDIVPTGTSSLHGSADSTNGVDGTWETASLPAGISNYANQIDGWRRNIKAISFTGGKRVIRYGSQGNGDGWNGDLLLLHVYGEKTAGQTPNDLIFIDHDTTPGVEYQSPEDFGDRPLATSVVRQFRVKNVSATLTANAINIQCNDADFAISTDSITWVVTIAIASLAPGAQSATMYIRNTTPAVGGPLGPRFSRITALVGSFT